MKNYGAQAFEQPVCNACPHCESGMEHGIMHSSTNGEAEGGAHMNLLNTLLIYMTMVFVSSVQAGPEPTAIPVTPTPSPTMISILATPSPTPSPTPTAVPTPDITPNNAYGTLQLGDKGEEVTQMQTRLVALGFYSGDIDGVFGYQTLKAVQQFQYYQGLSVDGIAGKRTLTVLYESDKVVPAPTEIVSTPTPTVTASTTPAPAITTPPATDTSTPTFAPTPTASPTDTPEPTQAAAEETAPSELTTAALLAEPVLMSEQTFIFAGNDTPLTLLADMEAGAEEPALLHPLEYNDTVYVPVIELIRDTGSVVLPGANGTQREVAFTLNDELYQINFELDENNSITQLEILKQQEAVVLPDRSGFEMENVLYLAMQTATDATGITFTFDEAAAQYTVELPGGEAEQTN